MSIKDFFMRKILASKLKNVPEAQRNQMLDMIQKNPELFQQIGREVQEKMSHGMDQMAASMEVMRKYEGELRKIM